jgi:hypothetical protein
VILDGASTVSGLAEAVIPGAQGEKLIFGDGDPLSHALFYADGRLGQGTGEEDAEPFGRAWHLGGRTETCEQRKGVGETFSEGWEGDPSEAQQALQTIAIPFLNDAVGKAVLCPGIEEEAIQGPGEELQEVAGQGLSRGYFPEEVLSGKGRQGGRGSMEGRGERRGYGVFFFPLGRACGNGRDPGVG